MGWFSASQLSNQEVCPFQAKGLLKQPPKRRLGIPGNLLKSFQRLVHLQPCCKSFGASNVDLTQAAPC